MGEIAVRERCEMKEARLGLGRTEAHLAKLSKSLLTFSRSTRVFHVSSHIFTMSSVSVP